MMLYFFVLFLNVTLQSLTPECFYQAPTFLPLPDALFSGSVCT